LELSAYTHPLPPLPSHLQELTLSDDFNADVANVVWPSALTSLIGGGLNQPFVSFAGCTNLRELNLQSFDISPLPVLPLSLQVLQCDRFSHAITDELPNALTHLSLRCWNHDPTRVKWPNSLLTIDFGDEYNHPLVGVSWPTQLRELVLGKKFAQTFENVQFPKSLRELDLYRIRRLSKQKHRELVLQFVPPHIKVSFPTLRD
jgi:hypothetical protein